MKKMILCFLIAPGLLWADIDFTKIKGLYTVFRTKQYLSPIFGFAWWNGAQVEKLYRYGDPDTQTVKLVQELFYLNQADGLTFGPTILPTKIGSHITPRAIGVILNVLDEYVDHAFLNPSQEQKLEKSLENALAPEIQFESLVASSKHQQEQMRMQFAPEISDAKKQEESGKSNLAALDKDRDDAEQAVKDTKQKILELTSQSKVLKKKPKTEQLESQIDEKQKELVAAKLTLDMMQEKYQAAHAKAKEMRALIKRASDTQRLLESKIKNAALSQGALKQFSRLLVDAFQESLPKEGRYIPFTIHNILLSLLWKKAVAKKDFITYFSKLNHGLFVDPSFLSDNSPAQRIWLQEQYSKKSYQEIGSILQSIQKSKDPDMHMMLIKNNFEQLVAAWNSYEVFTSSFPPQVLAGWTSYQGYEFADCASSSLRNALNNMIYMPAAGTLLLSQFSTVFTLNSRVHDFYTNFNSVEQILEQKTRDAWAQVTSGLTSGEGDKKIDYKTPPGDGVCEIAARTGLRNMNNLVRQLFGINSIDDFARLPNVTLSKQLARDENFGIYTFTINNKYVFKWYFDPWHFFVSIEPQYVTTDSKIAQFMSSLGLLLQQGDTLKIQQANDMVTSLFILYRDRSELFDLVIATAQNKELSNHYIDQLILMLFNSASVQQKRIFIQRVLGNAMSRSSKHIIELLKRLIHEMILDVEQHYSDIIQEIIKSPIAQDHHYAFHSEFERIVRDGVNKIKDKYPALMPEIADTILNYKRDKYYALLKKNNSFTPRAVIAHN